MLFTLILVQLMVMPDVLLLENYVTINGAWPRGHAACDCVAVPGERVRIFLLRQTFKTIPRGFRRGGADRGLRRRSRCSGGSTFRWQGPFISPMRRLVSFHWNNFIWPLIITNSVETRPLTVGLHLRVARPGHRLVDHLRGDVDDIGPAPRRLPAVSAAVRAELPAHRHSLMKLITWNIQWGLGADGVMDPARIVR